MAWKCAHCGRSDQMQTATDYRQCLACGNRTSITGEALPVEPQFLVPSTQPEVAPPPGE
jgi:hypothetical protein